MRRHDELSIQSSCFNKAKNDEMIFVLLGRDASAPVAIRAWIADRIERRLNSPGDQQIIEAEQCAATIERELAAR